MNHGKGSVVGQLVPVKYNRLTLSETVSVEEPAGRYMEMLEYRNSARGHLMALEDKIAMEGYLETNQEEVLQLRVRNHRVGVQPFPKRRHTRLLL